MAGIVTENSEERARGVASAVFRLTVPEVTFGSCESTVGVNEGIAKASRALR